MTPEMRAQPYQKSQSRLGELEFRQFGDNAPRVHVVCYGPNQQGRSDLQVPKIELFAQAICPTRSRPASITGRTTHRLIVHAVDDMLILANKSSNVRIVQWHPPSQLESQSLRAWR